MANKLYEESAIRSIADAIREKNGSEETYTVAEMSAAVRAINTEETGGVDTSDATVSESDLAEGVIAYGTNGQIVGTLPVKNSVIESGSSLVYEASTVSGIDPWFTAKNTVNEKQILKAGASIGLQLDRDLFGDALPSDVKKGVTFTSAAGLKAVGTKEESIPDGGLIIKTGTVTSDSVIETGLSSVKQFILYRTSFSSTGLIQATYNDELGTSYVYCSSYGSYITSCSTGSTAAPTINGGTVTWTGTGNVAMANGDEYKWIAIGEE